MVTKKRIYQINSSRIIRQIRQNRGISRIAIAEELNLDRSTITKVVRLLIETGLVRTTGKFHGKPGVGRMATGLEINPDFGLILGIEIQTELIRYVLCDLDGTPQHIRCRKNSFPENSLETQIVQITQEACSTAADSNIRIIGIGIGLSGIIDPVKGHILQSYPLQVERELFLREVIERRTGLPVFVENDANCCCWGRLAFGEISPQRNFMTVLGEFRTINIEQNRNNGIAVGLGFVINGEVLHGDNFTAGEFRSLRYDFENCPMTQFALSNEEAQRLPHDEQVLDKLCADLAYNLSLLANTLDITTIVITGDLAAYSEKLSPVLRAELNKNLLYKTARSYTIEYPPVGEQAVCIGAAGFFAQKLFSVPEMNDLADDRVGSILLERILPQGCTDGDDRQ